MSKQWIAPRVGASPGPVKRDRPTALSPTTIAFAHFPKMTSEGFETCYTATQSFPEDGNADPRLDAVDSDQQDTKLTKNARKRRSQRARRARARPNQVDKAFGHGEKDNGGEVSRNHEIESRPHLGVTENGAVSVGKEAWNHAAQVSKKETSPEAALSHFLAINESAWVTPVGIEVSDATGGMEQAGWITITAKPRKLRKKTGSEILASSESTAPLSTSPAASMEVAKHLEQVVSWPEQQPMNMSP